MKVRNNTDLTFDPRSDRLFIEYIGKDKLPAYKKAVEKFGKGMVMINYYPQAKAYALIYAADDVDVDLTRFWEIYENIESESESER